MDGHGLRLVCPAVGLRLERINIVIPPFVSSLNSGFRRLSVGKNGNEQALPPEQPATDLFRRPGTPHPVTGRYTTPVGHEVEDLVFFRPIQRETPELSPLEEAELPLPSSEKSNANREKSSEK
jgi:hypothetical protein